MLFCLAKTHRPNHYLPKLMRLQPRYIVVILVCALCAILFAVGWSRSSNQQLRKEYATLWSGREDGTLDFRLANIPSARYLLYVPPDYDPNKKYELWVTLHGIAAGSEEGMTEWYWYARQRKNVILVAPHGVHKIKNPTLPRFAYWVFDRDPDANVQIIDEVCRNYAVDPNRIAIFGTSAGAPMALAVMAKIPGRVWFAGLYGYEYSESEILNDLVNLDSLKRAAKGTALYIGRGEADNGFSKDEYEQSIKSFKALGFSVNAVLFPGLTHDDRNFRQDTLDHMDRLQGRPPRKTIWEQTLVGDWKAKFTRQIPAEKICHDDPGASEEATRAVQPAFDDSTWQSVPVPCWRTQWKGDWNGDVWSGETVMRKNVDVPGNVVGHDLWLDLGLLESIDQVFFNGVEIGHTGSLEPYWLWKPHKYGVPGKLVVNGHNTIAVRFFDRCGGGGITHYGPSELRVWLEG
ncbi:MAG: hypothetical protein ABUL49_00180 [bacterium]